MDINDKDGKDSIERRIIDSEQKTKTCMHALGFEGQKDSLMSTAMSNHHDHIDEPLDVKKLSKTIGKSYTEDSSIIEKLAMHKHDSQRQTGTSEVLKVMFEQPSDHSDLHFDIPRHNPSLHHQIFETIPDDSQEPVIEKECRRVDFESSQEHDKAIGINTKTEVKLTSDGESNYQIDLPKKELKTFVVENCNQEHIPKSEEDPLGVAKSNKNTSTTENSNQEHLPTSELQTASDDLRSGIASSFGEEEKDQTDKRTSEAEFQSRSPSTLFDFWWIIPLFHVLLIFLLHHNNLK